MSNAVQLHVRVPATSANLGPGFDCMGVALNLFNEFTLDFGPPFSVEVVGAGIDAIPRNEENFVVRAIRTVLRQAGVADTPLHWRLTCHNSIPTSSGLGSSASAIVAGLLLGNELVALVNWERRLTRDSLLALAIEMEGHPDNVLPALCGGAWLCHGGVRDRVRALALPIPEQLTFVAGVPDFALSTADARRVLPAHVSLECAVQNVASASRLMLALASGDLDLLTEGFTDSLHEPHREAFIPGMQAVRAAVRRAGATAVTLSGAGPSLLAWCKQTLDVRDIHRAFIDSWRQFGIECHPYALSPCLEETSVVRRDRAS